LDARASDIQAGSGASRLVAGHHAEHEELEQALARWLGYPAALVFTSGYAANVGLLSALGETKDVFFSDAQNHASLIDGMRLSRAEVVVFPHNDLAALARSLQNHADAAHRWVVTESYFSMDADTPDLRALQALVREHDASLILDETHAVGTLGPQGRGLAADVGVAPDILIGAFGKAFGLMGGFVVGPTVLRHWLWNAARSFVFSTGLSPAIAAAACQRVDLMPRFDRERAHLAALSTRTREGLLALGAHLIGHGPIIPWQVGDARRATQLAEAFASRGVHVHAMRPPTVPEGTSRLRLSLTASHQDADVTQLLHIAREVLSSCP
jgi:8-amino-7-oxononanoate synthase